jgi:hypothetical protein
VRDGRRRGERWGRVKVLKVVGKTLLKDEEKPAYKKRQGSYRAATSSG